VTVTPYKLEFPVGVSSAGT